MTDSYGLTDENVDLAAERVGDYLKEIEERDAARAAAEEEASVNEEQALAQQEDPRNAETWGAKAFI